jgi:hypothetical protein
VLFRSDALCIGKLLDLLSVFIGTGKEENIIPKHSLEPRYRVGKDYFVGIAYVRLF